MKPLSISIISLLLLFSCQKDIKPNTKVIVLGTVHFPTKQVNADSIYNILKAVQPDLIVMEADSSVFNSDFTFKKTYDENEYNAILKYIKDEPTVMIRPMGFEGRNAYREKIGIYSEAGFIYNAMYDLFDDGKLSEEHELILNRFDELWEELERYKDTNLVSINQPKVDRLIDSVNSYQYIKAKEIVDSRDEFYYKILGADKDSVTLKSYFKKWVNFEGTQRNDALATNLIKIIEAHPNKTIIALTGFKHRSYIITKLKKKQKTLSIDLKEFHDL
nr:hypothetical protein [uncultured Psychroserpens sp.]